MKKRTFSAKHYSRDEGMMTAVWGPGLWHALHTMSFNYPVSPSSSQKKDYREFMLSLQNVLPCGKCRANLKVYYKTHPLTNKCLSSRRSFSMYVYKLHEAVNKLLGKKSGVSYCYVRELYEHFRARCVESRKKTRKFVKKEIAGHGCSDPLHGTKSKCVLRIVPAGSKCKSMKVHSSCLGRGKGRK